MTRPEWQQLEKLCHAAIEDLHADGAEVTASVLTLDAAIRTTGAFAAAVADTQAREEELTR